MGCHNELVIEMVIEMKRFSIVYACVLSASLAIAAPIRGLVDGATGQGVPDADIRYYRIGSPLSLGTGSATNIESTLSSSTNAIPSSAAVNDAIESYVDPYQSAPENLGTGTNVVWLPTRYSCYYAPTNDYLFGMSTNIPAARIGNVFHGEIISTNAITLASNMIWWDNDVTPSGTNTFVCTYYVPANKWIFRMLPK